MAIGQKICNGSAYARNDANQGPDNGTADKQTKVFENRPDAFSDSTNSPGVRGLSDFTPAQKKIDGLPNGKKADKGGH